MKCLCKIRTKLIKLIIQNQVVYSAVIILYYAIKNSITPNCTKSNFFQLSMMRIKGNYPNLTQFPLSLC